MGGGIRTLVVEPKKNVIPNLDRQFLQVFELLETRFTPIYDFGYVAMNFGWVYPEDSGEYICRATNLYGTDETRAIIKCSGKTGIIYESQLPKGMMSIEKIREMESGWQRAPELIEQVSTI